MWTKKQFQTAMKKAGWRLASQVGTYTHKDTGLIFHPYNYAAGEGEAWLRWAEMECTPPTEARKL